LKDHIPMNIPKELKIFTAAFCVFVVTSLAFFPSLHNDFVNWDDRSYVRDNPAVASLSVGNSRKIFGSFSVGNYQPLTLLSYALDYHFFGHRPFGCHLTNLLFHALNGLLVFWLVLLLGGSVSVAFLTAVFFGVHPLHVESVAWVSGRKDVLYAFFFLGALVCYCYYLRTRPGRRFYFYALVLFLFSLLSKATAVTLPLVLFLLDRFLERKGRAFFWADKAPFIVLSLAFGALAFFAQDAAGAVRHRELFHFFDRVLVALFAVGFYLTKTFWPVALSCLYPYFVLPGAPGFFLPLVAGSVAAAGAVFFYLGRFSRVVVFSGLFFLLTLLPVLQFVPLGQTLTADRYMYLPILGIAYGASEGVAWLFLMSARHKKPFAKIFLALGTAVLVAALGTLTWKRCGVWRDSETLWSDVLARYPDSATACNNLGGFLAEEGRDEEAIPLLKKAIERDPSYSSAYNNLGMILGGAGKREEAIAFFTKAAETDPRFAWAYNNLCEAYTDLGRFGEALVSCERAIRIQPDYAEAYVNLGVVYFRTGRNDEAAASFKKALESDPACAGAYNNLGSMAAMMGQKEAAAALLGKAVEIAPDYAEAYGNLAFVYLQEGQKERAAALYRKARELGFLNPFLSEELGPYPGPERPGRDKEGS